MKEKRELSDIFQERKKTEQTDAASHASKQAAEKLPPSRRGKRSVTGWFDPQVHRQLRLIAADEDKTLEQVLGDALNAHFQNHGMPPIA